MATDREQYKAAALAQKAHLSLKEFIKQAWAILEPNKDFKDNWHIDVICEHLEAVDRGEIKRLVINIPPRCMKSLIVSVFYPAWKWAREPGHQFICASHSASFASRDNLKMRDLIKSDWYQEHWPHVKLAPDQNKSTEYSNTAKGHRIGIGMGGGVTGMGGDTLIFDDMHSADATYSDKIREKTLQQFRSKFYNRLNDSNTGAIIVIMQRLHEADGSGYLLGEIENEEPPEVYEHLMIPMEFDPSRETKTSLGYYDDRTVAGELLWEDRFDAAYVKTLRISLGTYGAAGQLDQSPSPPEGGMWKRDYFREYTTQTVNGQKWFITDDGQRFLFDGLFKFAAGDLAFTTNKRSDYTVLGAAAGDKRTGYLFMYDLERDRIDLLDRDHKDGAHERKMLAFMKRAAVQFLGIEKAFLAAQVIKNLQDLNAMVRAIPVDKDKDMRFHGVEAFLQQRKYFIPAQDTWVSSFLNECTKYPNASHDDQFDTGVYLATEWVRIINPGSKIERHKLRR